ncbi:MULTISPECIES: hypothetical protein [unclassified Bosea (in: a-proteobacteria)]|uniref:hypothetical protein n=1 Tax=unclassified Bosea (in: a-proteobacteria) TaxID=2653178 RepID=UPI000F74EEC7|nr:MULTISPECIES: hypothetical protein [unclassified Bosea (in: a-proteobacteria)]AZO76296.1 hypothetical protein BLM15_00825 [Bosea sp. Tri-49]RXT26225.1 hypothetical protein B5U98_06735 [Bosea sp. Tri-39]RXT31467.1 hypothetical protein B5U99_22280 [Bosea sp. Tri-54]RXT48121.1 hypothetical protein B6S44_23920 [Bosea sp. Tri-44]
MTGIPDPAQIEAAQVAVQAEVEKEAQKQSGSVTDVLGSAADIAGNVMFEGVGEVVYAAVGTVAEGVGTVAVATGEAVVTVIGGIFEGLG